MTHQEELAELQRQIHSLKAEMGSAIPVMHDNKIFIVKLRRDESALFAGTLKGSVYAECLEADNAAYILDFIN